MNWKTDLKLADLDGATRLEITCRRCGLTHYRCVAEVMTIEGMAYCYLDEVEASLFCSQRSCKGGVRIALVHDGKTEGFVGGMA